MQIAAPETNEQKLLLVLLGVCCYFSVVKESIFYGWKIKQTLPLETNWNPNNEFMDWLFCPVSQNSEVRNCYLTSEFQASWLASIADIHSSQLLTSLYIKNGRELGETWHVYYNDSSKRRPYWGCCLKCSIQEGIVLIVHHK